MDDKTLFEKLGLKKGRLKKVLKNETSCKSLRCVIVESGLNLEGEINKSIASLLIDLGLKKGVFELPHLDVISKYIVQGKFTMKAQINEAVLYLKKVPNFDAKEFDEVCGAGIIMGASDIKARVGKYFDSLTKEDILLQGTVGYFVRYCKTFDPLLKFTDGKLLFSEVQAAVIAKAGITKISELKELSKQIAKKSRNLIKTMKFHVREIPMARNPPEVIENHKKITRGEIRTRFPPEPNGYLHIGHARAMIFDFGYADEHKGLCYLRYDDTNPEAESNEYVNGIREMVEWMGFKPKRTTFASNYFEDLFDLAVQLIKKNLAYVDFSTKKEIELQRKNLEDSPFREKYTAEENLKLFMDMKHAKFPAGKCSLRCKIQSDSDNPNMRDFVAYRIKYVSHPHVGDKWCIYPTYDFTHCLVDSLENITHSMCTMEFETRRDSYYWLLHVLGLYKPFVWEFSRLNLTKALLSKRKINKLVERELVRGFDDPRLLTLIGLRRRGYTPEIIREFCLGLGASRVQNSLVDVAKLEQVCRLDLDKKCRRFFCVLNPLKVVITNCKEGKIYDAPNHPKVKTMGSRKMPFSSVVYIDRSDFRLVDHEEYFGLAPNKAVGLRYGPNIFCKKVVKDGRGEVKEIHCEVDYEKKVKTKGHIHWLSENNSCAVEVRLYDHLLTCDVLTKEMDIMERINKDSEIIMKGCLMEKILMKDSSLSKPLSRYQFERVGYFTVDLKDSNEKLVVFNSIVPLKESKEKKSL